jgi:hypothetical protein
VSKADDDARMLKIKADPVAQEIFKALTKLKPERRLYPDLYALELAEAARKALEKP